MRRDDSAERAAADAREELKLYVDAEILARVWREGLQVARRTPADYADEFLTANDYYEYLQESGRHLQVALQAAERGLWSDAGDGFWRAAISADSASTAWPQVCANLQCLFETACAAAKGLGGEVDSARIYASTAQRVDAHTTFRQQAVEVSALLARLDGTSFDRSTPSTPLDPTTGLPQYGPVQAYFDSTMNQIMWGH